MLEKILESLLDCKEIQPVHPKGNQSWIFIGRTDGETEAPILWLSDVRTWLFGKDPDSGKDWRQEEKGMTGDDIVGWHHRLDGLEFEQAPGVGDGQGGLACCSPWGHKELDMTDWLNWTKLFIFILYNNSVYLFIISFLFFWLPHVVCGISVPWPGTEPMALAVQVQRPNQWTTRKFSPYIFLILIVSFLYRHYYCLHE